MFSGQDGYFRELLSFSIDMFRVNSFLVFSDYINGMQLYFIQTITRIYWETSWIFPLCILLCTVVKVDGATPKRWRFSFRGHDKPRQVRLRHLLSRWYTLQGTNISPQNGILKMIFLFPRWDMLIAWRVNFHFVESIASSFGTWNALFGQDI